MAEPRYLYRCFASVDYSKESVRVPIAKDTIQGLDLELHRVLPSWRVQVERFLVTKETPAGVWITDPFSLVMKKFVLLRNSQGQPTLKRWANPTIEEALEAFRRRMGRAIEHAEYALHKYRSALDVAKQPDFIPEREWETKHVPTIF